MSRFIVMDVVFYGGSLNYDQGSGNYQELKKITKWDGRQYTLVSRYALRYSILETAKMMGLWDIADGSKLVESGEGNKQVIQPKPELLLNGEILKYPEFDLFGYLITSTVPQASRVAPVKISHAISLTPFYYDNQFAGNIGLAKRRLPYTGKMDINLFTIEEHYTYYVYTVVIDLDKIGENEVYLSAKDKDWEIIGFTENSNEYTLKLKGKKAKNAGLIDNGGELKIPKKLEIGKIKVDSEEKVYVETKIEEIKDGSTTKVYKIIQKIIPEEAKQKRIAEFVKVILNLTRNIKGRSEDLSPKLMIVGIYNNVPYQTFKDRISLVGEFEVVEEHIFEKDGEVKRTTERKMENLEERTEIIETSDSSLKTIKHNAKLKVKKTLFQITDPNNKIKCKEIIDNNKIWNFITELFSDSTNTNNAKVAVFYEPPVEVEITGTK